MTSPQHQRWIRSGMQWCLARPLVALRDRLRSYGYTVYDIGDTGHMDHIPPEDHTPYSETGWPGTTPYGWVTAIDIMPPPAGRGLPSLQQLGRQLHDDRLAGHDGVAWLKYMNWGPDNDHTAIHCKWTLTHQQSGSGDTGHTHLSCRSDRVLTATAAELAYDPIARLRGEEGYSMSDSGLIQNAERGITAFYTGADPVQFPAPWPGVPAEGFENPLVRLENKIDALTEALAKVGATLETIATHIGSNAPLSGKLAVSGTLDVAPAPTPLTSPVTPNN